MDATSTKKIGKYEITGILGRGGMGVVYRAEDKRIGRLVAIKTLTEGFSGQPDLLERFYREAQAGILQHPNIVIVYDLGDEDGIPFIVMEHVNGEPLDKIITSGRQLPLIDKLSIIEQVCAALGYAHQRGVVHRDIKPANVIVQPDGHAKIVDFGIARVQSSNAETGLTRTGNVIGTIHYIAPERLRGQPFDGRSDIFSTGVMLYLLLTGALPFSGEDMTVLQKLVNEPHPPLTTHISGYPPYLDTVLDRALAKDPEQRYATAEEFAADLRAVSEDLKKGRVNELFDDAERLTSEQQFGRAREVLQQLIKIDAQHTGAKQLLGLVQQNLARMQRAEQVRQLVAEADEALASSRFQEALASLDHAIKLDTGNVELQAKLEAAKEKKRRHDEINTLLAEADASRNRGDLTGALKVLEKALRLDQDNTKLRATYTEFAKQAKLAAQQGQIREMLVNARQEVSARRFTAAIEILREVSKLDPSLPELESLLQAAASGQEQERRRKLLEQVQAQVESCLLADEYDRATELVNRAVEQLPTEASLLQLKTKVAGEARKFRVRQLVDITAAKAQETFASSPHEALSIVQRALQELPGEERLLALEDSLRQRLKNLQSEEVRGRYLREAQEAIDRNQFENAIGILESYQLEFSDTKGVNELLDFARTELAQQQRQARIASCAAQAKSLIQEERIDEAIGLLDPVCTETGDSALLRLLTEARGQQAEAARKLEVLAARVAKLRESGQLDEAIKLLETSPAATAKGTQLNTLLTGLRAENARKQAIMAAIGTASQALEKLDFHAGLEALQSVRRAYGDSADLARVISDYEARRTAIANEVVSKSVEAARTALLANDAAAAAKELQGSAGLVEFAEASQQADWHRLRAEAAKPPVRRTTASIETGGLAGTSVEELDAAGQKGPESRLQPKLIALIAGGLALVVMLVLVIALRGHKSTATNQPPPTRPGPTAPIAPPTGTLNVQGNLGDVDVFVDGVLKGFTQSDGKLSLPLEEGTHSVRFTKAGYENYQAQGITINANKEASVPFNLNPNGGAAPPPSTDAYLTIHSLPGASVSIDRAQAGRTDAQGNLIVQVKPGKRSVQIGLDSYQTFSQSVNVKAGEKKPLAAALVPNPTKPITVTPAATPATTTASAPAAQPVQILSFSASAPQIEQGQSTTLKWETANASEVTIDNGIDAQAANGHISVSPSTDTTYTLTAKGAGGSQQKSIRVAVAAKPPSPSAPPPPAPSAPVHTAVDEKALLREAVREFQSALDSRDVAKLQSALGAKQARDFQNFFKTNPEATIKDDCPLSSLVILGDTAEWTCTETTTIKSNGKLQSTPHPIRFSFVKKDGAWSISGRR
ncbi:MAG TPA: protein kinase [Silvibacterium sp.]|nr:protein kinase [Silvibacterium sp.]